MDALATCLDKWHFRWYPFTVTYQYNSRGFRDNEWPNDLYNSIWCLGDSFTVGLGSPFDHTWPQVLGRRSGRDVINVSMDGASNQWISRQGRLILQQIRPKTMIIMWSFFHRREMCCPDSAQITDMERRLHLDVNANDHDNLQDFLRCFESVQSSADSAGTHVMHLMIPNASPSKIPKAADDFLGEVHQKDRARDGFHFDLITSETVCDKILVRLAK